MSCYSIKLLGNRVRILMIERENRDEIKPLLRRCVESDEEIFYNINEGDDEISVVVDTKLEQVYRDLPCVYYPDTYRVVQIHEECSGIDHVGIVSQISSLFTDIGLSILYFNTYRYNFVLVKEKDADTAVKALEQL